MEIKLILKRGDIQINAVRVGKLQSQDCKDFTSVQILADVQTQ